MPEREANKARYFFEPAQLGPDTLQVARFVGRETLSQLFHFELELISEDPAIDFQAVINRPATLTLMRGADALPVHGLVADFQQGGRTADYYAYKAMLVPRLWRLSLSHQSRIFQNETVEKIVTGVLQQSGFTTQDYRFALSGSYPPREYCTQYRETDLNFICRLLEHEGIQFFFEHGADGEVVVFTDRQGENPDIEAEPEISYHTGAKMTPDEGREETIHALICREQMVTGKVVLKDYNYRTPEANLQSESQLNGDMPGVYSDYGDHFKDTGEGSRLAKVRNEEIECRRRVMTGDGICLRFRAGHCFTLKDYYRDDLNQDYLITEVTHHGSQREGIGLASGEEEGLRYRNEFTAIPAAVQYRPPRRTPKPEIPGIMTANIESNGGDYAYLDDQGTYRAKMHFDLSDRSGGTATRPIRMKQAYSGPDYGIHFPHHENTEMIWACVNGDVDRPLALGTAPNPSQKTPAVAENKTQNVVRTFAGNELLMEDKKGNECTQLYSPYAQSIIQMGYPGKLLEGIGLSTQKTCAVHAKEGITLKAGEGFAPDTDAFRDKIKNMTFVLSAISVAAGKEIKNKKATKAAAKGFNSAFKEWKKGMGRPDLCLLADKNIGLFSPEVLTGFAEKGIGLFTEGGTDIVCENGGVTLAAKKGGANVFVQKGGIALRTYKGNVLNRTEKGGVKLAAGDIKSPEGVGAGEIKADAKKKVSIIAQEEDVTVEAKKKNVTISAAEKITLECGQSSIELRKNGTIQIKGKNIKINGNQKVMVDGMQNVDIKSNKKVSVKGTMGVKLDGMKVTSKAKLMNKTEGTMVSSKAKANSMLKGAIVLVG